MPDAGDKTPGGDLARGGDVIAVGERAPGESAVGDTPPDPGDATPGDTMRPGCVGTPDGRCMLSHAMPLVLARMAANGSGCV